MTVSRYLKAICANKKVLRLIRGVIGCCIGLCLNYVPAHLATEIHVHELIAVASDSHGHSHGSHHEHEESRPRSDQHSPHPESDHSLIRSVPTQFASQLPAYPAVIVDPMTVRPDANPTLSISAIERVEPSAASPAFS